MRHCLLPLTLLVIAGLVVLTGALGAPLTTPATLPLSPNVPDAAAEQVLDRSIAAMAPERLGCLEAKLWQKVTLPDLAYEANGRYLLGTDRRFRLEMSVQQGGVEVGWLAVSDGATLWEAKRSVRGKWTSVTKREVSRASATNSEDLFGPHLGGISPLLRNLRGRLNWVKLEQLDRAGKPRVRLTGIWKADYTATVKAQHPAWPAGLPEQCRLELDPSTLWPYRVEWWGPASVGAANTLVAELEFREPVIHTQMSPERCAREFACPTSPQRSER